MAHPVLLRPIVESDLVLLSSFYEDPVAAGEFEWFGFRTGSARELQRRWHDDGLTGGPSSNLAATVTEELAGWVDWKPIGSWGTLEIGVALFPQFRAQGIGTEAQRQLVDLLFDTTTTHRIQAETEVANVAEQRSLERVGFRREGVRRGLYFRAGAWRDSVMYSVLRTDDRQNATRRTSEE